MLIDGDRHLEWVEKRWSEEKALRIIDDIFEKTTAAFDPETFWPAHKDEACDIPCNKSLYFGATGTLLGLDEISRFRKTKAPFSINSVIDKVLEEYRRAPDTEEIVPSYFLGETGILLFHFKFSKSQEVADTLFLKIKENINNPVNEVLWGCPGTMLAALYMFRWTQEGRWRELFIENVDYLFEKWHLNDNGQWVWTQDLYNKVRQIVGAEHGFFGNVYPLLQGFDLLDSKRQQLLLERIADTTIKSAKVEGDLANWPVLFEGNDERVMVQWCHGSPGVITSLGGYSKNASAALESLLLKGGELIWKAGPLKKGVSICHGTDGNGYAFLKLYRRTGEVQWLNRARAFAMHAIENRSDRYTLWTGDVGLACYLISCIEKTDKLPGLDFI
tara:strand:- start:10512 stop:11675 length:1164 start_codon:yes stop_codon:yes gene_type:complete